MASSVYELPLPASRVQVVAGDEHPLACLLRNFRYKRGWEFVLRGETLRDGRRLYISFWAEDAYEKYGRVQIGSAPLVPVAKSEMNWQRWLREHIACMEMHEMDEAFVVVDPDGTETRPYDPHKTPSMAQ